MACFEISQGCAFRAVFCMLRLKGEAQGLYRDEVVDKVLLCAHVHRTQRHAYKHKIDAVVR